MIDERPLEAYRQRRYYRHEETRLGWRAGGIGAVIGRRRRSSAIEVPDSEAMQLFSPNCKHVSI